MKTRFLFFTFFILHVYGYAEAAEIKFLGNANDKEMIQSFDLSAVKKELPALYASLIENSAATFEDKAKVTEKRLRNNQRIVAREKAVNDEYDKYLPYFKQDSSDEQEMATILAQIEFVANSLSMRVADMKPNRVKRTDFYNNFSVTLTIEGELPAILHFLYTLQNPPNLFATNEIYFERSAIRTSSIKCRLIISKVLIP